MLRSLFAIILMGYIVNYRSIPSMSELITALSKLGIKVTNLTEFRKLLYVSNTEGKLRLPQS